MKKLLHFALAAAMAAVLALPAKAQYRYIGVSTDKVSLVMVGKEGGELNLRHFGRKISDPEQFAGYRTYSSSNYVGDVCVYPTQGAKNYLEPALAVTYADGSLNTELRYVSHSVTNPDKDIVRTEVQLKDSKQPLEVKLVFDAFQAENVIVCHSEITNAGKKEVLLRNMYSSALQLRAQKYYLTQFTGMWGSEMQVEHSLLTHGVKSIEATVGVRTSHKDNPAFMLSLDTESFDEDHGEVLAGALAWSGNYKLNFQLDEAGRLNILAGINPYSSEYHLAGGATFVTPEMVYTFTDEGAGQASRNLHDWARNWQLMDRKMVAPSLLNSWEGAYFTFNTKTLTDMMDDAASAGLEMFVLDDGWFGRGEFARNSDKCGLGDWCLNEEKLPEGISYLADYAHAKGLKFGIWIEPEMVSPKSELYQKHPDWVVSEEGRDLLLMRNECILDLTNPKVQDFVFSVFDETMQLGDIDYIKWDCNRHVQNVGSSYLKNQSHFWIEYTQGLYSVLARIRQKYPHVLVQSCASGGGRVDYGVLEYCNEVWTSDNTDALCRTKMQYGFSMIYPAQVMGSHISAVPNHQTTQVVPLKFRCDIAAAGRLGVELQPKSLAPEEKALMTRCIESYKGYRDVVYDGDLYRLQSPYEGNWYALMYVSKDKSRAVVFTYCIDYGNRSFIPDFRLKGLDPAASYSVKELNVDSSVFWGNGRSFGGDYLMERGLNLNMFKSFSSAVFLLEKTSE